MDSLTHIVVGAALGDTFLGKKIGRKAAWIGAFLKTFPDFDLFYSGLSDPKRYVLYHRSYTHSFFIELLTAFPLAWIFYMLFKKKISYTQWFALTITCLWLHSLMDWCTNYGTRLLLPFSNQPFSLNSIAILDLFLTLPIFIMVVVALIYKNQSVGRLRWIRASLIYTVCFFGMTFVNKAMVQKPLASTLPVPKERFMTNPNILHNFLWYGVAVSDSMVYMGEYSLLQKDTAVHWQGFKSNRHLLTQCPSPDARMLEWFSQGYVLCNQNKDTLEVFCLKFGRSDIATNDIHKTFIFYYQLFQENGVWKMSSHEPKNEEMDFGEAIQQLYDRTTGQFKYQN